jgi:dipeptidyl aminopeptidase/acylaminoacyl peptidase
VSTPEVDGTVEYAEFSPDGRRVLLGVAEPGADRGVAEGSGRIDAGGDLPDWIPLIQEREGWRAIHVYDVETNQVRPLSRKGLNVWEAAWCGPDRIAAVASDAPDESTWYSARLVLIDAASGEDRDLWRTGRADRQMGFLAGAPSGRRLGLIRAVASDRGFLEGEVVLVDPETGEAAEVDTDGVDVSRVAWRDDGRLLYAGLRHLESVVGEIDVATVAATELWAGDESVGGRRLGAEPVAEDGFVGILDSYERPQEIARFRDGKPETVVSFAHDGSRFLLEQSGRLETVTWTASDGLDLEGLLVLPEGSPPHALVMDVHGGPIGAYRNRWVLGDMSTPVLVSRGYAVFLPNPRGSTGRGQEFQSMVVGDMGGGDAGDLLRGVDALVERGIADPDRIGVAGGSYGGFMAAWLVTRTDRFAASVALSPVIDWYSQHWTSNIGHWDSVFLGADPGPGGPFFERSPVMFADRVKTPTLLTAGTEDRCTPPGQAIEFHTALKEHGVETALAIYPGEGHGVRRYPAYIDVVSRIVAWFERHMPPAGR